MIKGMHGLFYTSKAQEARDFIVEKLGFEHVDAGDGWLIFAVPAAEFGVHPAMGDDGPSHKLSFWCDDIEATVTELEANDVTFIRPIRDDGFGLTTEFELPGGVPVQIYEPRHPQP
jgi:catechol 2,3-dioxygenase-like lactoylglutathione lyase family enzyme